MAKSSSRSSGSSKMDNQMLYIGLAVVVVLLIAVFLYRNKKSEDEEDYTAAVKYNNAPGNVKTEFDKMWNAGTIGNIKEAKKRGVSKNSIHFVRTNNYTTTADTCPNPGTGWRNNGFQPITSGNTRYGYCIRCPVNRGKSSCSGASVAY
jgi:hypothetical protein